MLDSYTVLDFTDERGEIGPMLLGDLGADVIRVEIPGGTSARASEPRLDTAAQDLASLQFLAFNRNKRSIVLDPASEADRRVLAALIERADFIFESCPSRYLGRYDIAFDQAKALNPRIVYTRISPFGESGPYAGMLGSDLVVAAMGGPVSLQGCPERAPIRLSVPQVWRHAGVEAAAGAMVAHTRRLRSGEAQFVDVSAQAVMTWTMLNAMDAHAIQGFDFQRSSIGVAGLQIVHETLDGHIVAPPMSNVMKACLPWMIEDGIADASLFEVDWDEYDLKARDPDAEPFNLRQGTELCKQFFKQHTKQELFELGLREGVTLAPVNTLEELLALDHLQVRDYWSHLDLPDGKTARSAGLWCKPSTSPPSIRHAPPRLNEHGDQIRAEIRQPLRKHWPDPEPGDPLPFQGLRVTDFAWVGVGPISSKYLADHGADVVRVESSNRPDVLRGNGPFKDAEPGLDRSQFFGDFNTSKQSLSLDMKSPEAISIAKQLIARSDVLIESFAPGAIGRMGLGYEEVRALNPSLIMISTCLMGQTGPVASLAGYGYHAGAIAGFYEVTGWPDMGPSGPWVAYTDTIAPRFISVLLAAALDHRRRTGEGCYVDVAQIETALHFLGPEILDLQTNGYSATRIGNRSRFSAPQGCYPCAGEDEWCAIAVGTDAEWLALCNAMNRADWERDDQLKTNTGRLEHHDEIDAAIASWTIPQAPRDVMARLQRAGVPAGMVQRSSDLLIDPQYEHRRFYKHMDHQTMGNVPYAGHQFRISRYDNGPRFPAPALGQHSFEVLSDTLGFTDEQIGKAYGSGIVI